MCLNVRCRREVLWPSRRKPRFGIHWKAFEPRKQEYRLQNVGASFRVKTSFLVVLQGAISSAPSAAVYPAVFPFSNLTSLWSPRVERET